MRARMLIGGEWIDAVGGARFAVTDPGTDQEVGSAPDGGATEAKLAVEAAENAFPKWRDTPAGERGAVLRRLADLMRERKDRLAELMTREQGKPKHEAAGEVEYALSFIDWAAGEAPRLYGETIPASSSDKRILALRRPVGVTAAITPWNFPSAMITRKMGPALAAGCTMIVKPAEATPLSAVAIGELCQEAGVPAGVVNIVTGDSKSIAGAIFEEPAVRKVSFTGSTEVGKVLIRQSADNVQRLSLELGGHAPLIVFDDADLEHAARQAVKGKFRGMGQSCISPNRFYVQDGIYERFRDRVVELVSELTVGYGLDEGVDVGPLIDDEAVEKVRRHVRDAKDKGASVPVGGETVSPRSGLSRRYFAPTVIDGFTDEMDLASEETFGPVMPLRRFEAEDDAVRMANDSRFGLASYFFTRDASRLMRVAEALDYGIVGANDALPSTAQAPFGGMKESGYGREGGKYVMHEYTEIKYVSWAL